MTRARVLVTGGAGFIGSNLARTLVSDGFTVRCYDSFLTGTREAAEAAGFHEIVESDVADAAGLVKAAQGCRYVVHLAAQAGVPASVEDPVHDCEVNVRGTLNALIAARDAGVAKFVLASSMAPLGDVAPPAHEGIVPRPKSPYGASKLAGEAYCSAFTGSYGLPTVALRFSNVYGPHSVRKGSVVAAFCRSALSGGPIVIYGDGSQTRDFIYVGDLCAGITAAMATPAAVGVAQLGSGVRTSVREVAALVSRRLGATVPIQTRPPRTGDIQHSGADIGQAASTFGFAPGTGLREGIDLTATWFQEAMG